MKKMLCSQGMVLSFFLGACGAQIGTSTSSSDSGENAQSMAADMLSDVSDAIADSGSNAALAAVASLSLEEASYGAQAVSASRSCTGGGSAGVGVTVNVTFSGSQSVSATLPRVSTSADISESGSVRRIWTPPTGQTLECNNAATHVKVNWLSDSEVNGLVVSQSVSRTREASRTITINSTGLSKSKVNNFTASGTRTVTWATGTGASGSSVTRTKTITSDIQRTAKVTGDDGADREVSMAVKTQTEAPLVVKVVRSATTPYTLSSKTVESGTVVATRSGKDRVESTFSSVVYDMTSSTPCLPTSGSIAVKYYSPDTATEASKSYTVSFGASTNSTVSIQEEGGSSADFSVYNSSGCDLEREKSEG